MNNGTARVRVILTVNKSRCDLLKCTGRPLFLPDKALHGYCLFFCRASWFFFAGPGSVNSKIAEFVGHDFVFDLFLESPVNLQLESDPSFNGRQ